MAVRKATKSSKKTRRNGKALSAAQIQEKRRELVGRAADLVIKAHRDALKELERH